MPEWIFFLLVLKSNSLEGPDANVVDLHGGVLSVPGGVPSLLAVVKVHGSVGGGVHPGLGVGCVGGVIGEVTEI